MKTFHCTYCRDLVFFENVFCLNCGNRLAYLPDRDLMAALQQQDDATWRVAGDRRNRERYRLCHNYSDRSVCNWAIPAKEANVLCRSCRLTHTMPDLTPSGRKAWASLESAKRRLVQGLLNLDLPVEPKTDQQPEGVAFEFLKDSAHPNGDSQRVLTGHDNGLITINIAEADDVHREAQRQRQREPYRTLLGHFRHEIGHYYWDRLIRGSRRQKRFRSLFGDERANYARALERHYNEGPPRNWAQTFISSYATSHPWEDWAETWAHFLHMTDSLETAGSAGLSLKPRRAREPTLAALPSTTSPMEIGFDRMIERWLPLTYIMNNLSRGLGHADNYPFVLTPKVIEKLRFVFDTIDEYRLAAMGARSSGLTRILRTVTYTALATGVVLGAAALVDSPRESTRP